jgi:hypothetical protein
MKKIYVVTGVLAALLLSSFTTFAQSQSREDLLKAIDAKHKDISALENRLLQPAEEDRAKYAEFLQTRNTGLIRLLPREKYDTPGSQVPRTIATPGSFSRTQLADLPQGQINTESTGVRAKVGDGPGWSVTTNTRRLTIRGGGAYYSFTRKTHEYGQGSDIQLSRGQLSVGFAGVDYGLMTILGDVPLETIGLELPEVNVLASYKAPSNERQARLEKSRFVNETELDGLKVQGRLPVLTGSTYLLRSFNYGETDVLVAFRVVRVDTDGSVIILYKLLKKFSPPQLARN